MRGGIPQSELLEKQRAFVHRCANGEFVEVMQDFYADDAHQIEGDGSQRQGKTNMIAFERTFLENVKTFHGIDIGSIAVASDDGNGNGVTMAEYTIKTEMQDGSKFWPEQVQVSTWKNGKIVALRYYYNPNF